MTTSIRLPVAAFGATGHVSTRVIFGAAALGGMSQERADVTLEQVRANGESTTSTPPPDTARRRIG